MAKKLMQLTIVGTIEIETDDYPECATAQEYAEIDMDTDSAGLVADLDILSYTAEWKG
jgi:hypothetical protein